MQILRRQHIERHISAKSPRVPVRGLIPSTQARIWPGNSRALQDRARVLPVEWRSCAARSLKRRLLGPHDELRRPAALPYPARFWLMGSTLRVSFNNHGRETEPHLSAKLRVGLVILLVLLVALEKQLGSGCGLHQQVTTKTRCDSKIICFLQARLPPGQPHVCRTAVP